MWWQYRPSLLFMYIVFFVVLLAGRRQLSCTIGVKRMIAAATILFGLWVIVLAAMAVYQDHLLMHSGWGNHGLEELGLAICVAVLGAAMLIVGLFAARSYFRT
jgi:hypothetical protein